MTFFLTGATGFVGSAVTRQLIGQGHRVRALVRDPARGQALAALGVELHPGDVTDKASMRAPMLGVDGVFHVAGWYKVGVSDRGVARAINVDGTRHVLELMQELAVPAGVYTSTLAVNSDTHGQIVDESYHFHGKHVSVYDETKAEAHRIAESFIARELPLIIVQPGLVYGPGDTSGVRTMFIELLTGKLPAIPKVAAYCWAHIDDIARGHVLAMERGQRGRNYFLAGPPHTLESAIVLASEIAGVRAPKIRMPPGVLRVGSAIMSVLDGVLPVPPAYTSEGLRVIAGVTYLGSGARAKEELGWTVRPLREGLTETLAHEMRLLGKTIA